MQAPDAPGSFKQRKDDDMRDFRDAKAMAQTIRTALAAKGLKISIGESLELIAKALGAGDWNTLAAAIKAAPKGEPQAPPGAPTEALEQLAKALGASDWASLQATIRAGQARPAPAEPLKLPGFADPASPYPTADPASPYPPARPPASSRAGFSATLEATLHRAVALAQERKHEYTTLEHLLLALIDDADAAPVVEACRVDLGELRETVVAYVDNDLGALVKNDGEAPRPTAGFHRVIQRAVIHVQSAGRPQVTGANVLVAIFSEAESHAHQQRQMTRYDAVNFIAHGVRKDGSAAA
jgi:hypothetical protein